MCEVRSQTICSDGQSISSSQVAMTYTWTSTSLYILHGVLRLQEKQTLLPKLVTRYNQWLQTNSIIQADLQTLHLMAQIQVPHASPAQMFSCRRCSNSILCSPGNLVRFLLFAAKNKLWWDNMARKQVWSSVVFSVMPKYSTGKWGIG